ncbi:MAG: hypothetical protein OHK0040_04030 [bacterium]
MPIYEFECKNCGIFFETFLLKSDEKVFCPNCKSENVVKLISVPNLSGTYDSSSGCSGGHSTGFS